jgi:hypothetical protein
MSEKCQTRKSLRSFDHLVGASEQCRRHYDAERSASRSGKSLTSQLYREQQTFMGAVATP